MNYKMKSLPNALAVTIRVNVLCTTFKKPSCKQRSFCDTSFSCSSFIAL